jgi:histidyl-tRNA synthetase
VGFSIGLDRVLLVLEQRGFAPPEGSAVTDIYVVAMEATRAAALVLTRELRREFAVDCDLEERGFGAQMKAAGKSGARRMVLLGEEEWARGSVVVKDLGTGTQETVAREGLIEALRAQLRPAAREVRAR